MKVSIKKLPQSQVELNIEVPAEEFEKIIEKVTLYLGKDLEVEGFRKGKAPREIIEEKIGQEKILEAAAQEAIRENYSRAILENKIEAFLPPKIEILKLAKGNSFEFKAKTWTLPEIKLPDYKEIVSQLERREVKITPEEIERMRQEKEKQEKERLRHTILEKIAEKTEAEIPEVLVEQEERKMLENLKQGVSQILQISFEDYLAKLKKTEKEILGSFEKEAKKRVKKSLLLREIGKKENVQVTEEEVEKETNKILSHNPGLEKQFDREQLKDYTGEVLSNEKVFQILENFIQKK